MGRRRYILLFPLLPFLLIYALVALSGCKNHVPVLTEFIEQELPIQTDTVWAVIPPKAEFVHPVEKPAVIPVIPDILIPEEMIISVQEEKPCIDSAELMIPVSNLPKVTQYEFLTFHRVHSPTLFVPKGQWFFGGTVSYTDHSNSNYKMLILEDWEGAGYTVTGRMYMGYAIQDNLGIGVKAGLERIRIDVRNANLNLGDDLSFSVNNVQYISQQWSGTVFMRNFLSLFRSRQFGLFNDLELTFGGGTSKMISGTGDALKGTYESVFKASVGISPGIMVFMHNIAAIEVSVGILGFNTTSRKQITNQVYEGSRRTSGAKFGVDLLSVKLGGTIYLNGRRFKQR